MTTAAPLEIKVIYPGASGRRVAVLRAPLHGTSYAFAALGTLHLVVASLMYWGTWWRVDQHLIYPHLMLKTPLSADASGAILSGLASWMRGRAGELDTAAQPSLSPPASTMADGWGPAKRIFFTAYGWLALSTAAFAVLALAGGSAAAAGRWETRRGAKILLGLLVVLAWLLGLYLMVVRHGIRFPPDEVRLLWGALIPVAAVLGAVLIRNARATTGIAGAIILLAALGSVTALHLWVGCGALEQTYATVGFSALVFLVHSSYGWFILFFARRLPR